MLTNNEIKKKLRRDDSRANSIDSFSSSSSSKSSSWTKTIFELITGNDANTRVMSNEALLVLNQRPNEENQYDESIITINPDIISAIIDSQNPRAKNYNTIIQTFLTTNSNPEDLSKYYALILGSLAEGVALSAEDLIAILYNANDENVRMGVSQVWGELLNQKYLAGSITKTMIQAFEDSPMGLEQDMMDEVELTRNGTHVSKFISQLQSRTILDPKALADLNNIILNYYNPVRDAFISYVENLQLLRPDVTQEELSGLLLGITDKTQSGKYEAALINTCVNQIKDYMENVVKWGAVIPAFVLKQAVPHVFDIIREVMPIFIKAFYAKRNLACYGYDFYLLDLLPEPDELQRYENSFICIKGSTAYSKLYYIQENKAIKIKVSKRMFHTQLRKLFTADDTYKHLTLAEAEKLIKPSGGQLPLGNNRYFIAEVENLKTGKKRRVLMMIAETSNTYGGGTSKRLLQIEDELLKELNQTYKIAQVRDIIETSSNNGTKVVTCLYLAIEVANKKEHRLIFAKFIPEYSQLGVRLEEVKDEKEIQHVIFIYNKTEQNYAKKMELEKRNIEINNNPLLATPKKLPEKVRQLNQELAQNTKDIEQLKQEGCANKYIYPAIEGSGKILPNAIFSSMMYFTTHITNGVVLIDNYISTHFLETASKDKLLNLSPNALKQLKLHVKNLLCVVFITPIMSEVTFLVKGYGQEIPRSKKEQLIFDKAVKESRGIKYFRYRILNDIFAGKMSYLEHLVDGMIKFTKKQNIDKNEHTAEQIPEEQDSSSDMHIDTQMVYPVSISDLNINELGIENIANSFYMLLLTFRMNLPDIANLNKALNQFKDKFYKFDCIKDICFIQNDYYLIAENKSNSNSSSEPLVAKLILDQEGAAKEWQTVDDPTVIADVIQHSASSLKQDEQFFQIAIAALLEQGLPIGMVIADMERLQVNIMNLFTSSLKFISPNTKGMYRNLIEHAAYTRSYEFFTLVKEKNLIPSNIIFEYISPIVEKFDKENSFVRFVKSDFQGTRPARQVISITNGHGVFDKEKPNTKSKKTKTSGHHPDNHHGSSIKCTII